jgi:hypothetical protein
VVVVEQEAWAQNFGSELGGLIGPMCSDVRCGFLCIRVSETISTVRYLPTHHINHNPANISLHYCLFSLAIADYGKAIDLPQVGFYASTSDLSDPDRYAFYSRTYPSSTNQAFVLTNMLEELGLIPFMFILHYDDYLGGVYYRDFSAT